MPLCYPVGLLRVASCFCVCNQHCERPRETSRAKDRHLLLLCLSRRESCLQANHSLIYWVPSSSGWVQISSGKDRSRSANSTQQQQKAATSRSMSTSMMAGRVQQSGRTKMAGCRRPRSHLSSRNCSRNVGAVTATLDAHCGQMQPLLLLAFHEGFLFGTIKGFLLLHAAALRREAPAEPQPPSRCSSSSSSQPQQAASSSSTPSSWRNSSCCHRQGPSHCITHRHNHHTACNWPHSASCASQQQTSRHQTAAAVPAAAGPSLHLFNRHLSYQLCPPDPKEPSN